MVVEQLAPPVLQRHGFDEPMPPEGWAALRMFVPMPPPKQINRFHKFDLLLLFSSKCSSKREPILKEEFQSLDHNIYNTSRQQALNLSISPIIKSLVRCVLILQLASI